MIVSVGEVVWDIFPDKEVLGGAPINVAYHLSTLGLDVEIITRVGADSLGQTTKARLRDLGLSLSGVQVDKELPTGRVNITFDENNVHHFEIAVPAAWDNLDQQPALDLMQDGDVVLVYGTLAQRDPRSREVIKTLWQEAKTCFYDVNLRPPFTGRDLVEPSIAAADVVKMNDEELLVIADWLGIKTDDKKNVAEQLRARYDLAALVVTEGSKGAWVMADQFFSDAGEPVTVADTVGAGDAFFAVLIEGYLAGRSWPENLKRANRRGAYVASQHGATPAMPAMDELMK